MLDELVRKVSSHYDADIYVFIGAMFPPLDRNFLEEVRRNRNRRNALLLIDTPGGSAEAAYRMGRAIQRAYQTQSEDDENGKFLLYVHEMCKSAGTILSLAADGIIMSQYAELGPIDVQLRKDDEIGERTSGLTPIQALQTLQVESGSHFQRFFRQLRFGNELGFSTKLSADIAAQMAVGLMGSVYSQIDPTRLGEVERHVRVSSEYGTRLQTQNVKQHTVARLAGAYPSHEFVIDRKEARLLFDEVSRPTDDLESLAHALGAVKSRVIATGEGITFHLGEESEIDEDGSDGTEVTEPREPREPTDQHSEDVQSANGSLRPKPAKGRKPSKPTS